MRYIDPKNTTEIFSKKKSHHFLPVDIYVGGKEHGELMEIDFYFLIYLSLPCQKEDYEPYLQK